MSDGPALTDEEIKAQQENDDEVKAQQEIMKVKQPLKDSYPSSIVGPSKALPAQQSKQLQAREQESPEQFTLMFLFSQPLVY